MLTPQEVADHAFAKSTFGGYNMAMVDEFLDELTDDYAALYKENTTLKAKMKVLVDKVEEYRATEDSMRSALLAAQKMASSMVSEAEERKETLLADAEMEARAKIGALHDEIVSEQKKLNAIKSATADFITKARQICEAELRTLDMAPDLTPEEIDQTTTEAKRERDKAADIAALSEKIVASYEREHETESEKADMTATTVFPTVKQAKPEPVVQRAKLEQEPEQGEEEDLIKMAAAAFKDTSTRPIKLADLKFGRNYLGDDEQ